ncbi:Verru_Chthon cassette protein D [Prosthecobacter vanneervenii]|uniref:Uncharacterized protein (TIGR02596 family) n=1 Tax=Prosthecobacter vanneervenii TaxID=48466 RepID=A0A7W8DIT3_9BACT|nr:Verru_Chthon cassette protein D [Prosthecobacter vanneervenii]MBB5031398.1 uncharacterized protein (TIGR02596 family) [Prosthecobacter vanneervenii]
MHTRRHTAAFTLVELLVVLVILAIIVAVSAPYISGIVTASRLRTASDAVYARLLEAQSLATLFNADTELRIYEAVDLIEPDSPPTLRKLRIFTVTSPQDGAASAAEVFEPAGAVTTLEDGMVISNERTLSSILDLGYQTHGSDIYGRYIALRFHPDGSTQLQNGKPWFLTIQENKAVPPGQKLKNFITVQIDPASGSLRTFQP